MTDLTPSASSSTSNVAAVPTPPVVEAMFVHVFAVHDLMQRSRSASTRVTTMSLAGPLEAHAKFGASS